MNKIELYTDGGCRGNGKENNIGGFGVVLHYAGHTKEHYQGFRNVTNNQMEIRSVIEGLKLITKTNIPVEVFSDSAYVVNCINNGWYKKWMVNGWRTSSKSPVENRELWIELLDQIDRFSFIRFTKVKGHANNEGNNRADELANIAMSSVAGVTVNG